MTKYFTLLALTVFSLTTKAQTFIPKDTILANNVFQVEFSDDMRSMVWCENLGSNNARVWYADVDLNTGLLS